MAPQAAVVSTVRDEVTERRTPGETAILLPARRSNVLYLVVLIAAACVWSSVGDHALYTPDEGRYGSISMHMAEGGSWLVPVFEGNPHPKKPPLTYWAQALCLKWLGHHEFSIRLPSLIASNLLLLCVVGAASHLGGFRAGVMSAACLGVMPLFLAVSRLAITDAMLALFWFAALVSGHRAVEAWRIGAASGRWAVAMWVSVALGLLTKGPLALVPVGIILLWIAFSRQWGQLRALRLAIGLPLAALPIGLWVAAVSYWQQQAWDVWWNEMIGRTVGTGDHPEPPWYYVPVFLAGLFPATAMLIVPGWNLSWRAAWDRLRRGDDACLWALAVVVPFVVFSVISGKLASYLLPMCAPLALLTGLMLEKWLTGEADSPPARTRPPEVKATVMVCVTGMAVLAIVASIRLRDTWWFGAPILVQPLAAAWMWWTWGRGPAARARGLALTWAAMVASWVYAFEIENALRAPTSPATLVDRLQALVGTERPLIVTYGFSDPTLTFYNRRETVRARHSSELPRVLKENPSEVVLLALTERWTDVQREDPKIAALFEPVGECVHWVNDPTLILRPASVVPRPAGSES